MPADNTTPLLQDRAGGQGAGTANAPALRVNTTPQLPQCMSCGQDFGFFCARVECGCCHRTVCPKCRKFDSFDVQGRVGQRTLVCGDCYFNNLGIMLVFRGWFKYKVRFAGDLLRARKMWDATSGKSRIMIRMRTGAALEGRFTDEQTRNRLVHCATLMRNRALRFTGTDIAHPTIIVPTRGGNAARPTNTWRILLVYRGESDSRFWHSWGAPVPEEKLADAAAVAAGILETMSVAAEGMVRDDGTCLYALDRNAPAESKALASQLEAYVRDMRVTVMWSRNKNLEHRRVKYSDVPAVLTSIDPITPAVVVDDLGELVSHRNCSPAWRSSLAKAAGTAVLKALEVPFVAVASAGEITFYTDMFSAHQAVLVCATSAMFAVMEGRVVMLQSHTSVDRQAAFNRFSEDVREAADRQLELVQQGVAVSAASGSPVALEQDLECPVCMEPFDLETHRPCICGQCGNTACQTCMERMELCPSCRVPIVPGRYPPNVAIIRLLNQHTDTDA